MSAKSAKLLRRKLRQEFLPPSGPFLKTIKRAWNGMTPAQRSQARANIERMKK